MKNNKRNIRKERKDAKLAAKASAQMTLCRQAGEFHKAYLEIELGAEEAYLNALQARIDALRATPEVVITEETVETPDTFKKLEDASMVRENTNRPVEEW